MTRIWRHHNSGKWPAFKVVILLEGSRKECQKLERELRPKANIGWNKHPGGFFPSIGHGGKGVPKSPEHKEKMRLAALRRYSNPEERTRMQKIVKRAFKSIDRSGANNAMFGRKHSEETKRLISQTKRDQLRRDSQAPVR